MLPSLDLLEVNLQHLNHADLILKAGVIVEKGRAHAGLQNVSGDVTGPEDIHQATIDYAASVQAAADGGKRAVEDRNAKRLILLECLVMWGQHIIHRFKRRKDPTLLQNNGFDSKKAVTKVKAKGPTPVPQARAKHGQSEEILRIVKRIPGYGNFEVRYSTNPSDDGSWVDGGHHTHCQIKIQGLVPGTRYYFSLRYHGPNGTSAWSVPISIIVL